MNKDPITIDHKRLFITWAVIVALAISSLVILESLTLSGENRVMAFKTSQVLISELEKVISKNEDDKANLEDFLRDTYLDKARTVSYVLDSHPGMDQDVEKLRELAETMGVDEIHIFDRYGTICCGSIPKYFGLSVYSGDQIGFFKPMLRDTTLALSQEVTPNTAEGRRMLYAMCWNQAGTRMIQVGADGTRFPQIMNRNEIDTIISMIPADKGRDIILTQVSGDRIIACTNQNLIGKKPEDLGIRFVKHPYEVRRDFVSGFPEHPIYCSVQDYHSYRIIIAQYKEVVDQNLPITLMTFTEYLVLVFIAMSYVLEFIYSRFLREKDFALKDRLTGLYNRRAYENAMAAHDEKPLEANLAFVSMDVNGLKAVNDRLGHDAGDRLLQGAAYCIMECFHPYGEVFRYGGDEFTCLMFTERIEDEPICSHFRDTMALWSDQNQMDLQISVGLVRSEDYPDSDIYELARIADQKMYDAKASFYEQKGNDRRGAAHEGK